MYLLKISSVAKPGFEPFSDFAEILENPTISEILEISCSGGIFMLSFKANDSTYFSHLLVFINFCFKIRLLKHKT